MIFPTVILTFTILLKEKNEIHLNLILTCWVLMNVFWMLHELAGSPLYIAHIFMGIGGLLTAKWIYKHNSFSKSKDI